MFDMCCLKLIQLFISINDRIDNLNIMRSINIQMWEF